MQFDYCCHGIERKDCEQCSRTLARPAMTTPQGMLSYGDLPDSVQKHLLALEEFIGDCDGKDTVISSGDETYVDDGTIDASEAVRAFNGIVALLRQAALVRG